MKRIILVLFFLPKFLFAQDLLSIRSFRQQNEIQYIDDFRSFLTIPNIVSDMSNIRRNAEWIVSYMQKSGITNVQLLSPITPEKPPAVYGEVVVPGAAETIIFYAHYDGQPVDSSKWFSGLHPFKPQLSDGSLLNGGRLISWDRLTAGIQPDWRIYARGASDDKAGVFTIINAYAALRALNKKPTVNIKFFFEGEEEAGSTHLAEIFKKYKALLKGDMWVICDGPVHQSGEKQVVFGVRGDTHLELTVFGPKRPLHSGHYGNWVPNPAMELSRLLASMKNENGEVTIKGFYDDVMPLSLVESEAIKRIPSVDEQLKKELGIRKPERQSGLTESLQLPSLNINGIQSAGVGKQSANVIPTKAIASLDLRLVVGNDWQRQQQKVIDHIRSQGFHVVTDEPTDQDRLAFDRICMVKRSDGYNAQKTRLDHPFAQRIVKAVNNAIGKSAILTPTLGGSLPLFIFEQQLNAFPVTLPIANHDNNQHAENENIRIGNLWDGLEMFASIMLLQK
jgi:acetylornithine deacetylase/succinyl-diaminopimelate desuccinylase-like protein